MRINQNISAMNTHASMVKSDSAISKSLERLSSGLRINRAADDAAGLAISEKMRGQIRGLQQAGRNAQDGISLLQTAEGALNETHSILQRMRELSVQAANDTLTSSDRGEIQKEMDQLTKEIDRIAGNTEFNTKTLLRGIPGVSLSGATLTGGTAAATANGTVSLAGNLHAAAAATGTLTLNANLTVGVRAIGSLQFMGTFAAAASVSINGHTINGSDFGADGTRTGDQDAAAFLQYVTDNSAMLGVTGVIDGVDNRKVNLTAIAYGTAGNAIVLDNSLAGFRTNKVNFHGGVDGDTVSVSGTTFQAGNDFAVGIDADATAGNLAAAIGALGNVDAAVVNNVITVTASVAGAGGNGITMDDSASNGNVTASGAFLGGGDDADTISVDGTMFVAGTSFAVAGTAADTATNLANAINALGNVNAVVNGIVDTQIDITAAAAGAGGNAITLAEAADNGTVSGATLDNGAAATAASGTMTISTLPTVGTTVTVNGNTYTFVASGGDGTTTVDIGATTSTTADNLVAALGNDAAITASNTNGVITITAAAAGAGGNAIGMATSSTASSTLSLTMHIGANAGQSMSISVSNMDAGSLAVGRDALGAAVAAGTDATQGLDVSTQTASNAAITTIDAALSTVSSERSKLGAYQNRLEHTISNLGAAAENLSSSESRIRDVDMAEEMANFSRSQILMQASTAMMAQANQKPQAVLKLLG